MTRFSWRKRSTTQSRRLYFESLERRDLLAVMRLVTWNTLNGPNNNPAPIPPGPENDGNYFKTVLAAIGNETVQGNTKPIDILAVQEIDQSGNQSMSKLEAILDSLYPSTDYASVISTEVGGDATGFVYDTSTVSRIGDPIFITAGVTHPITRVQFRPADTFGESDFFVYSIHLKSGTTGADAITRGNEASVLRANADALGSGANVIFVGDFNMQNGSEAAYTTFVSAGAGQLQDLGNSAGNWHGSPAFKHLHSQDPRFTGSGLDDRFDIQFASAEFFDGVGIDYIAGSYHVFGNNGSHALGDDIASNSANGASEAVLIALANASDHLPVVADYEVIVSVPRVRLIETSGDTQVAEGSFYDTYGVVLDTIPAANVTVEVTPDADLDLGAGAGNPIFLLFTPANALTPQFIVVNAINDGLSEGNETVAIAHAAVSADVNYNGLSTNLNVTVLDKQSPLILINELDSDQAGTENAEFVELYDGGVGGVSLSGKTLVFFNGATDTAYLTIPLTGSTNANGYYLVASTGFPGANQTFGVGLLQNGVDAVALYQGAFSNGAAVTTTNLIDAIVYDTGSGTDMGLAPLLLAGQSTANESGGSSPTTHSLQRVPDGGLARVTETYVAKLPTPGARNSTPVPGVLLFHSGTRIDVAEGGVTDSYQIALKSTPTADVMITIDPDTQVDLGLGAGVPIVLTFTAANALIPQTVSVVAVNDILVESSPHFTLISHTVSSADSAYNAFPIGNVVGNITDNDVAQPTSVVISEIMYNPATNEGGANLPEWIEIVNTGTTAPDLAGWFFRDNDLPDWGTVPAGTYLYPNQVAVFFDADFSDEETFRNQWNVPDTARVLGVSWQNLSNSGEPLELRFGPSSIADAVSFTNATPWPALAGTGGPSIYLKGLLLDNSNPANWALSVSGANNAINAISIPGGNYSTSDIGSPGRAYIPGDYDMNGGTDAADYVLWRHFVGSTTVRPPDGSGPTTGLPNGVVDEPDYAFWSQNFGRQPAPVVYFGGGSSDEDAGEMALTESGGGAGESEISALRFDLAFTTTSSVSIRQNELSTKPNSTSASSSITDLLLILEDAPTSTAEDIDSFDLSNDPAGEDVADIDEFFAGLGAEATFTLVD